VNQLSIKKGIYILKIGIFKNIKIKIGALGNINFSNGEYLYIGSAQKNLKKRVERHLSKDKKLHWHIDYLLNSNFANIKAIYIKNLDKNYECITAKKLMNGNVEEFKGFGSSDCRCSSHLIKNSIDNEKYLKKNFKTVRLNQKN